MVGASSIATPPHPVLLSRAYRAHRAWRRGPGRHAGHYVAPLLVCFVLAFFGGHIVEESVCLSKRGDPIEDCETVAKWINLAFWDILLLLAGFSLSTSLIGRANRRRRRRNQRLLDDRLRTYRSLQSPEANVPLADLETAHTPLIDPQSPENQLPMAALNHVVLIVGAAVLSIIHIQQAQVHATAEGELGTIASRILVLGSPYIVLTLWGIRPALRLRRGAKELLQETQDAIASHEAKLRRIRDGTTIDTPRFSFRRFGGSARPGQPRILP